MTVPALPMFADGVLVDAADLNALVANVQALYVAALGPHGGSPGYNTGKKPQVVLRVTGTHGISSGTETAVIWDAADVNTDTMWASGTTITVQTTGTYRLSTQIALNNIWHNGGLFLYLCVNGTTTTSNTVGCWRDSTYTAQARASATLSLTAGSTIQVIVRHAAGSSKNLLTTSGGCRFEAIRIGPA